MADVMNTIDSAFDAPEVSSSKRRVFGLLTTYGTPIKFASGEGYSIPGVMKKDFDSQVSTERVFAGKQKLPAVVEGGRVHIVLALTRFTKDGGSYQQVKDFLDNDKVWAKQMQPSFVKVFGKPLSAGLKVNSGVGLFVALEEAATNETFTGRDGSVVTKSTWLAVAQYPDATTMQREADKYFGQFNNGDAAGFERVGESVGESNGNHAEETWNAIKGDPDFAKALTEAAGKVVKPKKEAAIRFVAAEWEMDGESIEAHLAELKELAI